MHPLLDVEVLSPKVLRVSPFAMPADPATLDQFRFYDKLCEISHGLTMETDAIPNNATRAQAQTIIDQREGWTAQADPEALAILHEDFVWSEKPENLS